VALGSLLTLRRARQARKESTSKRSRTIAALKSQPIPVEVRSKQSPNVSGSKRKRVAEPKVDGEEEDDPEARRLRARMEKAMGEGAGDSEDEADLGGEEGGQPESESNAGEDDEGTEDEGSFHTDAESEADDDDEVEDDDESERLEDGPIDQGTRQMRAKMQAAMEVAERRALGDSAPPKSAAATPAPKLPEANPDDAMYDLGPLPISAKPLPASVLRAAAAADAEKKERKAAEAKARAQQGPERKKRIRRKVKGKTHHQQVERKIA